MVRHRRKANIYMTKIRRGIRRERNAGKRKPARPRNRRCRLQIRAWWLDNGGRKSRILQEWSD